MRRLEQVSHRSAFCFLAMLLVAGPACRPTSEAPQDSEMQSQVEVVRLAGAPVVVRVQDNLDRLITEEDTDGDKKVTVDDVSLTGEGRGDKRFWVIATSGERYEVVGTYYLSTLLQELSLARDAGSDVIEINSERVFENPVQRISRSIRDIYWDGLTRRIDSDGLEQALVDEKVTDSGFRHLHVPDTDREAYEYFARVAEQQPELLLRVQLLPATVTPQYVKEVLQTSHGLLTLGLEQTSDGEHVGVPFVVPGGRFNEMYGWDSYFESVGLLVDGRIDLARAIVDNFVYQITHYDKILNANRSYFLTRSHPPFLTSAALAVRKHLPGDRASDTWLRRVLRAAIKEYHTVWMNDDRLTETGLSRYYGSGIGPPPEVEEGHFDAIYRPHADQHGMDVRTFEHRYQTGEISIPELDQFFVHDRCVRESGHDTTYRWSSSGDRCADFVTVDLNSLLYKIEIDIAHAIDEYFGGALVIGEGRDEISQTWSERAERRQDLMNEFLWSATDGMFFDYDVRHGRSHRHVSATTFYPMWAGLATKEQSERLVAEALPLLEVAGGIVASTEEARGPVSDSRPARQWDYPHGWPPHQMLVWRALLNYGFDDVAHRLIYRWLYTITRNAVDYNGTVPEKFDVVTRSHQVFAEYGNVGTEFAYITKEGFGWMNASYQVGLALLPRHLRTHLENLVPPEWGLLIGEGDSRCPSQCL